MRRVALAVGLVLWLPMPAVADDDERCQDGDCCVGIIAMCDNEFPLVPGGEE